MANETEATGNLITDPAPNAPGPEPNKADPGGAPGTEQKTKTSEASAPAPLTFADLKLDGDYKDMKEEELAPLLAIINDGKTPKADQVKAILGLHTSQVKQVTEKLEADWLARQAQQAEAIRKHPEMGGANLEASQGIWNRVLNEMGTPALREELQTTGMGNSPELGMFLLKIGKLLEEGKPIASNAAPGGVRTPESILYPAKG